MVGRMTTKQYLSQAIRLDALINAKLEQKKHCLDMALKITSDTTSEVVQLSKSETKIQICIEKLDKLEREIQDNISKMIDLKREIQGVIDRVEPIECKIILTLRYLNGMQWGQIAAEMSFSWRSTHRMHSKALGMIDLGEVIHNVEK